MKKQLKLLRVNMQLFDTQNEHVDDLAKQFELIECNQPSHLIKYLFKPTYDAICFDFDYPNRTSLRIAEETKQLYPSLPMLVITVQHSEQLAVWAFRSGMIDFLVKPLPSEELARCKNILHTMVNLSTAEGKRESRAKRQSNLPLSTTALHAFSYPEYNLLHALYYVEQNFDKKIPVATVAKLCDVSTFRFSRMFKAAYGITFRNYVVRFRLREACRLLQSNPVSVTEVAYAVGFNDVSYFSRIFKRHFSVSPSDVMANDNVLKRFGSLSKALELPLH